MAMLRLSNCQTALFGKRGGGNGGGCLVPSRLSPALDERSEPAKLFLKKKKKILIRENFMQNQKNKNAIIKDTFAKRPSLTNSKDM